MQDRTRPCAHCGDRFTPRGRPYSMAATYCRTCGVAYRSHYRAGTLDAWYATRSVMCGDCGERPVGRGRSRRCVECGSRYRQAAEQHLFTCAAPACHNLCTSSYKHARYCSDRCKQTVDNVRKFGGHNVPSSWHHWVKSQPKLGPSISAWPMFGPAKPVARRVNSSRLCMDCGAAMKDPHPSRKRCKECARLRNIARTMELYETAYKCADVKRAMMWRRSLVEFLRERDGDKCALCCRKMLFDVTTGPLGKSDKGATVDHVLPRSLGGDNDPANLQLAHWSCNRAKSNRGEPEQLRLVG